jgi:hypothetical protein
MTTAVQTAKLLEDDSYGGFSPITLRPTEPIISTLNASAPVSPVNLVGAVPQARSTELHRASELRGIIWTSDGKDAAVRSQPAQKTIAPSVDAVKGAKGVVLHVGEQSVQCEFLHGPTPTIVWLPRSLFPADAAIGFAFLLTVDRSNGFLGPKITSRASEPDPEIIRSVARMLDEFES